MSRIGSSRPRLWGPPRKRMANATPPHIPFPPTIPLPGVLNFIPALTLRTSTERSRNYVVIRAGWQVIKQWFSGREPHRRTRPLRLRPALLDEKSLAALGAAKFLALRKPFGLEEQVEDE